MKSDTISRQDVLDYIDTMPSELTSDGRRMIRRVTLTEYIADTLPSAEPEIIYCKYCRKHNQGINEAPYLTDRCPLILHRGYAQGHEFDYQYCVYAERKEDE